MFVSDEHEKGLELPAALPPLENWSDQNDGLLTILTMENRIPAMMGLVDATTPMDGSKENGLKSQVGADPKMPTLENPNFLFGNDCNDLLFKEDTHFDMDLDDVSNLILSTSREDLEIFRQPFESILDKADFFRGNRQFFACGTCRSLMKGDGVTLGTYRIKCAACKSGVSLAIALRELVKLIDLCHPKDLDEQVDNPACEETTRPLRKRGHLQRSTSSSEGESSGELESGDEARTKGDEGVLWKEMKSMMALLTREVRELREENAQIRKENGELRQMVLGLARSRHVPIQNGTSQGTSGEASIRNEPFTGGLSFSEAVASRMPASTAVNTLIKESRKGPQKRKEPSEVAVGSLESQVGDKSGPPPKGKHLPRVYRKQLSSEEYQKLFNGQPIRPPKRIVALYVNKGNGQTKRISELRHILKAYAGMEMRNVLHIDYVGKSIVEFHLYDDYLENFKAIAAEKFPQWEVLEGLDPLSDSLLKRSILEDKVAEAAAKYKSRLSRRIKSTPSAAHRRFLESELARANNLLNERMPKAMQIDTSISACEPTSTHQC